MELLTLFSGIAAIASLIFAFYQHLSSRSKATTEKEKNRVLLEQIRHLGASLAAAYGSTDLLIQRSKEAGCSVEELRNLGRATRGHLGVVLEELKRNEEKLVNWRFGIFFQSDEYAR